jgi:HSP20 family molecular chaperone IbpA
MNTSKELTKRDVKTQQRREMPQRSIRPDVDIYEDEMGITLMADLPGVKKE